MTTTQTQPAIDAAAVPAGKPAQALLATRSAPMPAAAKPAQPDKPVADAQQSVEYWYLCGDGATMR